MTNIPIFLPSDNNYAPFLATTMVGILKNTKSFIDFYVLDSGISEENQEKIRSLKNFFPNFSIEFIKIDIEKHFAGFLAPTHLNLATYSRFLISNLKPNLKKIIYLDSDIIVYKDIQEFYDIDLDKYILGAIHEPYSSFDMDKTHTYFNAGVLLIDNEKWQQENISPKLFETEKKYRNIIRWADQDVLNIVFCNNYKQIDEKYNYMSQNLTTNEDIAIRHFNTAIKPWQISEDTKTDLLLNHSDFWHYAKMTPFYEELSNKAKETNAEALRHARILNMKLKIQMKATNER